MGIIRDHTEKEIREAMDGVRSYRQILIRLKANESGGNYKTIKRLCKEYGIDTSNFLGKGWNLKGDARNAIPLKDILVKGVKYPSSMLKKRLLKEGLLEEKCYIEGCPITTEWLGEPIVLALDHINGDNYDNRIENVRLLCPNCHSQTDDFCGKIKNRVAR